MKLIFSNLLLFCLIQITSACFAGETVKLNGSWIDHGGYRENSSQGAKITLLKYSPDGKYIYTYSSDSLIRKWDNETCEILFETKFDYHGSDTNILEFYSLADISPDGEYILISHWKQNIYDITAELLMYDLNTKQVKLTVNPPYGSAMIPFGSSGLPVYVFGAGLRAMFSFDGSVFAANVNLSLEYSIFTETGVHTLMNSSDGKQIGKSKGGSLQMQAISKDSKNYAYTFSISYDMNTHLPSVNGLRLNDTNVYLTNHTNNLAFTNDSKTLAWIANDLTKRTLMRWDITTNELLPTSLFEYTNEISLNMLFTNNDRFIVCDKSTGLSIYQYPSAAKAFEMNFPFINNNRILKMNPVKNEIAGGGGDGILRIIKLDKVAQGLISIFRADTTIVVKGTALKFNDYSYGEPDAWLWDFGDGITSSQQNPEHIYTQIGTYSVGLIAKKGTISDTSTKLDYINVVEPSEVNNFTKNNENSISISPNPASDFIMLTPYLTKTSEVIIYSAIGSEMYKGKAAERINVSILAPGIYFLKAGNKVYKFVKIL